jgi:branched-chain amino acid transport system substrate-binding protein
MARRRKPQANSATACPPNWRVALSGASLYLLTEDCGDIRRSRGDIGHGMRFLRRILLIGAGLLLAGTASAETLVGLAVPLSGPSAILGEQMRAGATTAAALLDDAGIALDLADDRCTAEGGAAAARQFVATGVKIVVGFLCTEAIEAALPILSAENIPVITPGVRTDSLTGRRKKTGWDVMRLGPRADAEREAVANILTRLWQDELFAIVDDGTIYGRELSESFRLAAEQAGLKPVFVDTFRPQLDNQIGLVGRLRKAGATHVLAGGDRDDIAIIASDAAQLNAGIVVAGGETLRAQGDIPLTEGMLMIALPEWSKVEDPAIAAAFVDREIQPEGYVLPAFAAVQVVAAVLGDADASGKPLAGRIAGLDFATVLGTVRFDDQGDLAQNPYRAFRFDGSHFVPIEGAAP